MGLPSLAWAQARQLTLAPACPPTLPGQEVGGAPTPPCRERVFLIWTWLQWWCRGWLCS